MLLTETYRALNKELHSNPVYGLSGYKWAKPVSDLCGKLGTVDVLDYGCGKKSLEGALGFSIKNYDPCIEGLDSPPEPADVVACTDVLEHIEPECIDAVLDDLKRVVLHTGFFVIANRAATKNLPDGRNAHLIQQPARWWLPKLCERFDIAQLICMKGGFIVLVKRD